jgi:hypothetical protein
VGVAARLDARLVVKRSIAIIECLGALLAALGVRFSEP